jgi:hypothetical protein
MEEIIFDDAGSYPLPEGVSKEWVQNAFKTRTEDEQLFTVSMMPSAENRFRRGGPQLSPVSGCFHVPEGY